MATGDIRNNLKILSAEIRSVKTPPNIVNLDGMLTGDVDTYLPIYDYVFQWYSSKIASEILQKDLKLPPYDHDKAKFIETMYRILRELFQWRPPLSSTQFLSTGFAEKKIIMCADIIKLVKEYNAALQKGSGHACSAKPKVARPSPKPAHTRPPHVRQVSENSRDKTSTSAVAPSSKAALSGKIDALLLHLTEVQNSVKALKEQMLIVMNQTESMLDKVLPVVTEIVDELNRREEGERQRALAELQDKECPNDGNSETTSPQKEETQTRELEQAVTKELVLES
uniref:Centrosomal protein of 44 kDa n=1 Tax=Ornithodoros turicata TaxID=34597 RepID=A0A2R5LK06_9ACAR